MSVIRSSIGGGYVAETELNGKRIVSEFTNIVDAAEWIEGVENGKGKIESEEGTDDNCNTGVSAIGFRAQAESDGIRV